MFHSKELGLFAEVPQNHYWHYLLSLGESKCHRTVESYQMLPLAKN